MKIIWNTCRFTARIVPGGLTGLTMAGVIGFIYISEPLSQILSLTARMH